jgi:hypothetical protein
MGRVAGDGETRTMDDGQAKKPAGARQERLKQALRENLKRRKVQARQRKEGEKDGEAAPSDADDAALAKDGGERDE